MSSARQAVTLNESLTGAGKVPALMRCQSVDLENGMNARTCSWRRKPVSGRTGTERTGARATTDVDIGTPGGVRTDELARIAAVDTNGIHHLTASTIHAATRPRHYRGLRAPIYMGTRVQVIYGAGVAQTALAPGSPLTSGISRKKLALSLQSDARSALASHEFSLLEILKLMSYF